LFGNFTARAMEPVGHIAGVASAVIGSVSGMLALVHGTLFGRAYDGTVLPLIAGFTASGLLALTVTELAERGASRRAARELEISAIGAVEDTASSAECSTL
jgi:MFS transporter, DHA1 family, multidrug resistance protein